MKKTIARFLLPIVTGALVAIAITRLVGDKPEPMKQVTLPIIAVGESGNTPMAIIRLNKQITSVDIDKVPVEKGIKDLKGAHIKLKYNSFNIKAEEIVK